MKKMILKISLAIFMVSGALVLVPNSVSAQEELAEVAGSREGQVVCGVHCCAPRNGSCSIFSKNC